MTKILIQNAFNDHKNDGFFLAGKPNGEVRLGDYIILEDSNLKIEIVKVEKGDFGNVLISVRKMPISLVNISELYNKEFFIQKADLSD